MIVQLEYIKSLKWTIYILHNISCNNTKSIIRYLQYIDCPNYLINGALNNLNTCNFNIGLTYSNPTNNKSIVVLSKSTSIGEYTNTITHEIYHLVSQLRKYNYLNEEQTAQLCGNLNMKIYKFIKKLQKYLHI